MNQKQSFQFPEVRVVEASAGSGKTFTLAKRYVQLLLKTEQSELRNILALTFTNKASYEMKARILEFLKSIALGCLPKIQQEIIVEPLGLSAESAQVKSYQIMKELISHYNFFQVQTIDKFINSLLSGCAFKIGLTASFRIRTNARDYLEYSLDQLIDSAPHNKDTARVFHQFLHNYLYLENRTGWFPKEDMLGIITTLFKQNNTYGLDFKQSIFKPQDVIKKKKQILDDIHMLHQNLPEGTKKIFITSLEKFCSKHKESFDIDSLSTFFQNDDFPAKKDADVAGSVYKLWDKIRGEIKQLAEEEATSLFNPYVQVYNRTMDTFVREAAKDDVLFLEELNKRAERLFDEGHITVAELYYRLATRFRHYLIDEFQDTSRLQWANLEMLAEEALSSGGSLFYVGDRKQAIYGFRGGDVDLFNEIKDSFQNYNVQIEPLTKNWRSQKAIVEFNNQIFSKENLEGFIARKEIFEEEKKKKDRVVFSGDDINAITNVFNEAKQSHQEDLSGGYVKFEIIDFPNKEERYEVIREKVIHLIKELQSRYQLKDIALLTRSNSEVEALTNWLLEEDILVESERTSNVKENGIVDEILSFLQFLNSPIDNLAFTRFILGDAFSKATGIENQELHDFVFSLRSRMVAERDLYIYTEFRKAYPKVWDQFIDEFFKNVGLYPLYETVLSIYASLNCLGNFPEYQGYLMHFLNLIKVKEEDVADLASFLEYYDELEGEDLYVKITDSNAIKILTVHKAKGLEFPVVILPFSGMNVQVGAAPGDNQQSYIMLKKQDGIELLRHKAVYTRYSKSLYQIYANEYKHEFVSELNNIYVALTRARDEMYGFIPAKVGNSHNLVAKLIPESLYELGAPVSQSSSAPGERGNRGAGAQTIQLAPSQYRDWLSFLRDEFMPYDEVKNREVRKKGEVIHFILQQFENLTGADLKEVEEEAFQKCAYQYPDIEDLSEYKSTVHKLFDHDNTKGFFFLDEGAVFNEFELVNAIGHTKRIDRLIVKESVVEIIDFKSSKGEGDEYHRQVREYMNLVGEMYSKKEIKGFLIYLDELTVEEITNEENMDNSVHPAVSQKSS